MQIRTINPCFYNLNNSMEMNRKKISKFLKKLYSILDNPQYCQTISWDQVGENVVIKSQSRLQEDIIPSYFSLSKFSSFMRQLHLYNFHKKKSGDGHLVFHNPCFQRSDRQRAAEIVRKRKTKAQLQLLSEAKSNENTVEMQKSAENEKNVSTYECILGVGSQDQQIHSCRSLEILEIKSYQNIPIFSEDPYDILNFIRVVIEWSYF